MTIIFIKFVHGINSYKHAFWKGSRMEKQVYISDEEKVLCQKVADAFSELYENEDLVVLDAGKYGFVKLQCYIQLFNIAEGTPMKEMKYVDILKHLPKKTQKELLEKRFYFAEKTGKICTVYFLEVYFTYK